MRGEIEQILIEKRDGSGRLKRAKLTTERWGLSDICVN